MPSKTPPLRVLFVSHTAELNGAEQMLLLTLKALDRKKFTPSLVVPAQGPLIKEAERAGNLTEALRLARDLQEFERAGEDPK